MGSGAPSGAEGRHFTYPVFDEAASARPKAKQAAEEDTGFPRPFGKEPPAPELCEGARRAVLPNVCVYPMLS